jgi:hypothetical protein
MLRPRPIPTIIDPVAQDLESGRQVFIWLLGVNILLAFMLTAAAWSGSAWLWQVPVFILALEALFLITVFLPMLLYRLLRKKEHFKLAASRSLLWFSEALGLAV